ncbi:mechanosensitive ion channel family protein [Bizionia sp. M204]|uniref:mechanosensitive ion channel family protein n=1 Tax=unclassified Bizionia TaxID=2626393 RepID=UPI00206E7FE3|nr:mechanosensitive ion channel family protein [Bizionia sp. M204]UPS91024.1 mechanosensitive ion channel [Bizionia sp. M204]
MDEQFSEALDNLYDKLEGWFNAIIENIPNFGLAILVIFASYFLAKYINKFTYRLVSKQVRQDSVSRMVAKMAAVVIVLIGLFLSLGILNLSKALTSVLATAGVAGLAIGLALQNTLSNTVAGIVLSFREKIQIGNWIETNGFSGEVLDINLKNFVMKEADNNVVILPNKIILENPLKNYSLTDKMRIFINCGVGYESDLEQVMQLTKETIANAFDQVEKADDVEFFYTEFGDSSINYLCRFWVEAVNKKQELEAQTIAMIAIKKAYDAEGINIPFPIRTLEFNNKLGLQKENQETTKQESSKDDTTK